MSDSKMPEVPSAGKKAVLAIGSCAVAGAIIGSFVPVIGTVIGAGAGGILGGITVIVGEVKTRKDHHRQE
jgi:phage tail tape-measure protein